MPTVDPTDPNVPTSQSMYGIYSGRGDLDGKKITYNSFSGTDISAQILLPFEEKPLILGELQTISYSIHRENTPVRTLGRVNPHGFVKGPRTIGGSLIFTVFNSYAFYRLEQYKQLVYGINNTEGGLVNSPMFPLADMLPPFDIVLTFSNEYGKFARMKILGITVVDEGGTMSIEDLVTEQTYTYMARGIQPLTEYYPLSSQIVEVGAGLNDQIGLIGGGTGPVTGVPQN
jgi:hypothetical protein